MGSLVNVDGGARVGLGVELKRVQKRGNSEDVWYVQPRGRGGRGPWMILSGPATLVEAKPGVMRVRTGAAVTARVGVANGAQGVRTDGTEPDRRLD